MPEITGSNATAALKVATTFGTAAAVATGDKLVFESLTPSYGGEVLMANPLGSGDIMTQTAQKGAFSPTTTIERKFGYNDPGLAAVAQLFGGASVQTITSAFSHSIIVNEVMNQRYLTLDCQIANQSVMEHASAVCTSIKIAGSTPPNYITQTISLLAEDLKTTSTTNSYATVGAVTQSDSELVVFDPTSEFLINTQSGGALSSPTDRINIAGFEIEYNRPQQHAREAKGSAGNTTPVATNDVPFTCSLTVHFRSLRDTAAQFLAAYGATTEYKASITNTGTSMGTHSKNIIFNFPRLKIVEGPDFAVANAGNNEFTVKFMALIAASNPTGMIDVYPNIILKNGRSTAFSA